MNDKQQLAAMSEHMAERQPMCMAKRIEELEAQVRVMGGALNEFRDFSASNVWDDAERGALLASIDAALAGKLPEQHPDDAAVDRFATAMKAKLAAAREKGRGGWDDPEACSVEFLADLLVGHVGKGNPGNFEDIANLTMMLHQRGADPAVLAGKLSAHNSVAAVDWSSFPGWLIDHHEGDTITEEMLQFALADMLAAAPKPEAK